MVDIGVNTTLTQNENFTLYSKVYILMINEVSGLIFFGHGIFNALSMSLKNLLDENHKLHNFYE